MDDKWIIKTFNKVFMALFAVCVFCIGGIMEIIYKMPEENTRAALLVYGIVSFLVFLYYKFECIAKDEDYYPSCYDCEFTWWGELPFNPCNLISIIYPIAIFTNNRYMYIFMFFSSVFAMVALFIPCTGFYNVSLKNKRVLFFYIYHYLVLFSGFSTRLCGLYRPEYHDVLIYFLQFSFFNFVAYLINAYAVKKDHFQKANYFFNYDSTENAIFSFCYKVLPVKGLYVYVLSLPAIIIFVLMVRLLG